LLVCLAGRRAHEVLPVDNWMSFVRVVFADRHRTTPRTLTIVAPAPMLSGALRKPIIQ
jgi:hypothetical protein